MDSVRIHKLIRSKRRTVALLVGGDATLTVRAPIHTPLEYIEDMVRRKLGWIIRKVHEVQSRPIVRSKRFVTGESFLYLGDFYKLRIVKSVATPLVFRKEFVLAYEHRSEARELLIDWYKREARRKIPERVQLHAQRFGLTVEAVSITNAEKRWGSCTKKDNLNFSWRLVMVPLHVMDYVIVHELAHISEKNHSAGFWRKVSTMHPTHRSSREWLKNNEHLLHV